MVLVSKVCFIITVLWQLTKADLEVSCSKTYRVGDFTLPTTVNGNKSASFKRSDLECLLSCREKYPFACNSAWFDGQGNCHEFSHELDLVQGSRTSWDKQGTYFQLISRGAKNTCGGLTCSADQICINGCYDGMLTPPACLDDHRLNCDVIQEYSNVRNYYTPPGFSDELNVGRLQFVTYPKKRTDSGLRIQFNLNTDPHDNTAGCNRWFMKINGNECTNPATIEMINYSTTRQYLLRNMDMDGICYGIPRGDVSVELWVDVCAGYTALNALTAWQGARQFTIMEIIPRRPASGASYKPCPGLSHFNLYYETWVQGGEVTFNTQTTEILMWETVYKKLANDSALRIKYQTTDAYLLDGTATYCVKWFVRLNGTLCSPEGNFVVHPNGPNHYDYYRYHARTRTLECICSNNLPAGPVSVSYKLGQCLYLRTEPNHIKYGDLNRPSRLFIEEVRLAKLTDAVIGNDGKIYRSAFTNIARYHWYPLDSGVDNGDIVTVTYTKRYADTALKLTSSGDHRVIAGCARWFFKINGAECGNPGVINSVGADFLPPNMHFPMQTTGHCYGLAAGAHTITYSVGACSGYGIIDVYTGWGSAFYIFVEEVRLDLMKSCTGVPTNCN